MRITKFDFRFDKVVVVFVRPFETSKINRQEYQVALAYGIILTAPVACKEVEEPKQEPPFDKNGYVKWKFLEYHRREHCRCV